MPDEASISRESAEAWFMDHGLPWFVDDVRATVHRGLARQRIVAVGLLALALTLVGAALGQWWGLGWLGGLVLGLNAALVVALAYALSTLRAWVIARWALRRTFSSLPQLFPLVTRALPLLLLFVTFLFINAEVWQVAAHLDGRVMWLTVALFLAVTVAFLLARLPEELAVFDDDLAGLQKANLVLMLLITQLIQVVLLSLSVFGFFVVFGLLVMHPDVIASWIEPAEVGSVPGFERLSRELVQVSVFLAAFSGLYFTVYAVSDESYRRQFFTSVLRYLERAVGVRDAYIALGPGPAPQGDVGTGGTGAEGQRPTR